MVKIDKDILLETKRGISLERWPFLEMEIGDSFFLLGRKISSVSAIVRIVSMHIDKKFTCRSLDNGVRVWRIS